MSLPSHCGKQKLTIAILLLGAVLLVPKMAGAITPEDSRVKDRVKLALGFLEKSTDGRLGGLCLIGLCFKKAGIEDHPKIAQAVEQCYKLDIKNRNLVDNYSLGIGLVFLCEIDPKTHHDLIATFVGELLSRQNGIGAWTYPGVTNGDTSQTQYGVLGMWMAKNAAKIDIPIDRMEAACGWLMRTQDVGGGWIYQPVDPGTYNRTQYDANQITGSRSAASAGSLYMLAHLLQVTQRVEEGKSTKSKALQEIEKPGEKKVVLGPLTKMLSPDAIKNSLALADRHLGNGFKEANEWNHYFMYALERYHSFRDLATGEKDNKWYDQGYEHLAKTQTADGHWEGSDSPVTCTCFATLFLLRSTKKVIDQKLSEGVAIGGSGLPKDVRNLQVNKNGKVVDAGVVVPTEEILKYIEEGQSDELTRKAEEKEALALSSNATERQSQIEKLRKSVGVGKYEGRMVAVTTLSKIRDLNNVPQLLYALTDPDPRIVREADRGLCFISRKVNGVGLPEGELTAAQIKSAQTAWKAWYLSIRPNAELLD
jgi:hypothetical protein